MENRILQEARLARDEEHSLELQEVELFKDRKQETLAALEACMEKRSFKAGESTFRLGEGGDELLLIRRSSVRIMLPLDDGQSHPWQPSGAAISSARWLSSTARRARPTPSRSPIPASARCRRIAPAASELTGR